MASIKELVDEMNKVTAEVLYETSTPKSGQLEVAPAKSYPPFVPVPKPLPYLNSYTKTGKVSKSGEVWKAYGKYGAVTTEWLNNLYQSIADYAGSWGNKWNLSKETSYMTGEMVRKLHMKGNNNNLEIVIPEINYPQCVTAQGVRFKLISGPIDPVEYVKDCILLDNACTVSFPSDKGNIRINAHPSSFLARKYYGGKMSDGVNRDLLHKVDKWSIVADYINVRSSLVEPITREAVCALVKAKCNSTADTEAQEDLAMLGMGVQGIPDLDQSDYDNKE